MKKYKYLYELLKDEGKLNLLDKDNILIFSPCGSGKTYLILDYLWNKKGNYILYLCDNKNLLRNVNNDIDKFKFHKHLPMTMTYAEFGRRLENDKDNEWLNEFDLIVADELQNLFYYKKFNNDGYLAMAKRFLFDTHDNRVLGLTATPYIIANKDNGHILEGFTIIDYTSKEYEDIIMHYGYMNKEYIRAYQEIESKLINYGHMFKVGKKALIYTERIETMKKIETYCDKLKISYCSIWSENNLDGKKMTQRQIDVKNYVIDNGELPSDISVLLINRASETGINIYDYNQDVQLVISNTNSIDQQIQSRGRIRHDVNLLVVRTKKDINKNIILDDELLNKELEKETIIELIVKRYDLRNTKGKLLGVKSAGLKDKLNKYGYDIETRHCRKRIDDKVKRFTTYVIIKK